MIEIDQSNCRLRDCKKKEVENSHYIGEKKKEKREAGEMLYL